MACVFSQHILRMGRIGFLATATLLLAACNDENTYVAPPPVKVTAAPPLLATVPLYVEFTGNTAATATVDLEARVQGYLAAINYTDGEAVQKGRVLFEIEKTQYQAEVDQQKAKLESTRATALNASRGNERQSVLGERQASSQSRVEEAQTALATANADVSSAEAALRLAEASLAYTTITAPFDGVVTRHLVDVGALVGSSSPTKLATILQVNPIQVYFSISEQQQIELRDALAKAGKTLKSLREGKPDMAVTVSLSSDGAEMHEGRVDYIAPQLDPQTGTLEMRAVLENADIALVPGLFVRVRLQVGRIESALLVNDAAVMSSQAGSYVKVVGKENVVEQRQVTTGPVQGQLRVITGGLSADDRVVIGSIQRAMGGNTVEPLAGTMAALPEGLVAKANSKASSPAPVPAPVQ